MSRQRDAQASTPQPAFDGSLGVYVAYAMRHSPALRASFERWRAASLRISSARRLPEPQLGYAYFLRSVETRVGPQRQRFTLAQAFPWPTKLSASANARAAQARARQREFDALALTLRQRVADLYWQLWLVQEAHRLTSEHDIVLETLAGSVRARVQTGAASLADLSQVELRVSRHHDHHGRHREQARALSARLRSVLGGPPAATLLTAHTAPRNGLPEPEPPVLAAWAQAHPRVEQHGWRAQASAASARVEASSRLPRLNLGVSYVETAKARAPNVSDSGKDPVMLSLGLSLPLWWGSYDEAEQAARAEQRAHMAEREASIHNAAAELETLLARLRDTERQIRLRRHTLLPQAETSFRSVLGAYQTGRSGIAAMLLAQRDLLELQLELAHARAEHARAWARLEQVVGRTVPRNAPAFQSPASIGSSAPPAGSAPLPTRSDHRPLPASSPPARRASADAPTPLSALGVVSK